MLTEIQTAAVRENLARILASDKFAGARRLSRFLKFLVEESLAGRGDRLNQYAIGIEVFDRDAGFDPAIDPVVRVEAGRLRSKLRDYHEDEGGHSSIRITLARRGYAASFHFVESALNSARVSPGTWSTEAKEAASPSSPTIAVLPFQNIGWDPDQEYFADGFSEDLITDLSTLPGFSMIARQSSFTDKTSTLGVQQIGLELEADFILAGSLRRAGEEVRINAQLMDCATGKHL